MTIALRRRIGGGIGVCAISRIVGSRSFYNMSTPLPSIESLPKLKDKLEEAKRLAAYRAIDENIDVRNHRIIGIGSGSTVVYAAERLGQYLKDPNYKKYVSQFVCIPTGFQSKELILENGLQLSTVEQQPVIDIAFDGADEVDANLQLIKGGGGCLFQEKLVSTSAKKFIVIADYRKKSPKNLGTNWKKGIPIEVDSTAYTKVEIDLKEKFHAKKITLRSGTPGKAGPVVTDNGNFILDVDFGEIEDPVGLYRGIKMLVGVLEVGIFIDNASKVYFGNSDGTVFVQHK